MKGYYSLNMMRFNITKSTSGFTLIELLVVIAMISILAGALFMIINPAQLQRKAKEAVLKAKTSQLCSAMNNCFSLRNDATMCYISGQLGIYVPKGDPPGASYTRTAEPWPVVAASTITITGMLPTGADTCSYTCSFDFGDGSLEKFREAAGSNCL